MHDKVTSYNPDFKTIAETMTLFNLTRIFDDLCSKKEREWKKNTDFIEEIKELEKNITSGNPILIS